MISLESLSQLLQNERDNKKLAPLPSSFKEDASAYFRKLNIDMNNASNHREQDQLHDEEKNARLMLNGIQDRRLAKIMDLAILFHSGIKILEIDGLVENDREAFDILVKAVGQANTLTSIEIL